MAWRAAAHYNGGRPELCDFNSGGRLVQRIADIGPQLHVDVVILLSGASLAIVTRHRLESDPLESVLAGLGVVG